MPGSYVQFSKLTSIKEETKVIKAENMIKQLLLDHEHIIQALRNMLSKIEYALNGVELSGNFAIGTAECWCEPRSRDCGLGCG